jgi:hypothetical protein
MKEEEREDKRGGRGMGERECEKMWEVRGERRGRRGGEKEREGGEMMRGRRRE